MEYARFVAEEMKLDRETIAEIVIGALLHDIGRVGIKSDILIGKREISESEFNTVRSHCENGAKIIDGSTSRGRSSRSSSTTTSGTTGKGTRAA